MNLIVFNTSIYQYTSKLLRFLNSLGLLNIYCLDNWYCFSALCSESILVFFLLILTSSVPYNVRQLNSVMVEFVCFHKKISGSITKVFLCFQFFESFVHTTRVYWENDHRFYNWNQRKATLAKFIFFIYFSLYWLTQKNFFSTGFSSETLSFADI